MVVEDDPAIAQMVSLQLELSGYRTARRADGLAALEAIRRDRPDVVLLDIGLPGLDGIQVCRRLRAADDWTPILFVTARDDEVDRVVGLELGADDYSHQAVLPGEVIARIGSVLRRTADRAASTGPTSWSAATCGSAGTDEARVCRRRRDLFHRNGVRPPGLPHGSPGRVYSREQLMRQVWGYDTAAGTAHRRRARRPGPREARGRHDVIRTVRGVGYAAQPPDRGSGSVASVRQRLRPPWPRGSPCWPCRSRC
jgi:DNA-binding response OmpR family regulator